MRQGKFGFIAVRMAKRAGSETIEVSGSHTVYLSKPREVALLIERAAKALGL